MIDPWSLFEEAIDAPRPSRRQLLEGVLKALTLDHRSDDADRSELLAAVMCGLADLDAVPMQEALDAVQLAEAHGRTGWPAYYLARTAIHSGAYELALRSLGDIPAGFFEERGLSWRAVHVEELMAIARLHLGDPREAKDIVARIGAALATRGRSDDLAPPIDLVVHLLPRVRAGDPCASELLEITVTSIDIDEWFPAGLVDEIRAATTGRTPTSSP